MCLRFILSRASSFNDGCLNNRAFFKINSCTRQPIIDLFEELTFSRKCLKFMMVEWSGIALSSENQEKSAWAWLHTAHFSWQDGLCCTNSADSEYLTEQTSDTAFFFFPLGGKKTQRLFQSDQDITSLIMRERKVSLRVLWHLLLNSPSAKVSCCYIVWLED